MDFRSWPCFVCFNAAIKKGRVEKLADTAPVAESLTTQSMQTSALDHLSSAEQEPRSSDLSRTPSAAHDPNNRSLRTRRGEVIFRKLTLGRLMDAMDPEHSALPLTVYCFMSGWINVLVFSATFVWCGFQTGNTVQLSLAVARLFSRERDETFQLPDQHALISLISFSIGAFFGARVGDRLGSKSRIWLSLGTFLQALITAAAAIILKLSQEPSIASGRTNGVWTNTSSHVVVGLASASMGLQGIMAKRVNSHFAASVVLTTTWVELMGDPGLFFPRFWPSRDHKISTILMFFVGGLTSRAALEYIGSPAALGIACGIRFLVSIAWLFVPGGDAKIRSASESSSTLPVPSSDVEANHSPRSEMKDERGPDERIERSV